MRNVCTRLCNTGRVNFTPYGFECELILLLGVELPDKLHGYIQSNKLISVIIVRLLNSFKLHPKVRVTRMCKQTCTKNN